MKGWFLRAIILMIGIYISNLLLKNFPLEIWLILSIVAVWIIIYYVQSIELED